MILTLADWWDRLPIRQVTWSLPVVGDLVETRGGAVQVIETTSRQWQAEAALARDRIASAAGIEAQIDRATMPGVVVEIAPVPWRAPHLDPTGGMLGSATPSVSAVSTDGRQITLSGLPVGYTLSSGDWLSVETTGSGGGRLVRLYRAQATMSADASGLLGPLPVAPRIDAVVQAAQTVRLIDPIALAVLLPSDLRRGRLLPGRYEGASLALRQTLAEVLP